MELGLIAVFLCEGLLILFGVYLIWSWITKTPFYPSKTKPLDALVEELKLSSDSNFVDIGSGDGRIVVWGAKKGFNSEGIEFNPFLTLFSRARIFFNRVGNKAKIMNKNFNDHDFKKYNIAYLYIFPEHMDKISDKLFNQMQSGSVIITNTFKFTNKTPDKIIDRYYIYFIK